MSANKAKAQLSLAEWIDSIGIAEVAKLLRVNESGVRHWRRGYVLPKPHQMVRIKMLSRGRVSLEQMIENHFEPSNKNRWKATR